MQNNVAGFRDLLENPCSKQRYPSLTLNLFNANKNIRNKHSYLAFK